MAAGERAYLKKNLFFKVIRGADAAKTAVKPKPKYPSILINNTLQLKDLQSDLTAQCVIIFIILYIGVVHK